VQLLEGARALSPPAGAPLRSGLAAARPLGPGRILATGEAIGSTLPLTGEGIGKAMETGEIAALVIHDALQAGDFRILRAYVHRLRKLRRKYRGYQIAESWLTSGWLGNLVARRAKKSPYLRAVAARVLGEAADPRELFSIWGIFRSFLP
jgi:flavin-dependent dehydrogenase